MGDAESKQTTPEVETDERFPSGPWTGFYIQLGGRRAMELNLIFQGGTIRGEGRDIVGEFVIKGRYNLSDARVTIHKYYVRRHHVFYDGAADQGKGIWGIWELGGQKGGWQIW